MIESDLDRQTSALLERRGFVYYKIHGGEYQKSGLPDFIAYRNGQLVLIENKHPNGKGTLKALQYVVLKEFAAQGAYCLVSDSIEWTDTKLDNIVPGAVVAKQKYIDQALHAIGEC